MASIMTEAKNRAVRSQTLERGLDALQMLADGQRRTSQQLADALGLHRSVVYRILRTLEDYTFVTRAADGRYTLGTGIAALAEAGVSNSELRIEEVLDELAEATSATAIFSVPQKDHAVVLASIRPSHRSAAVAIRRSTRFLLTDGAPGMAILARGEAREYEADEIALARSIGHVHTKGSPFPGFEAVAKPLELPDGQPASIAVIFPNGAHEVREVIPALQHAALRVERPADVWSH
ncbi:helix-turn-helix domain-containing protein [Leucobacter chromiiresistens]